MNARRGAMTGSAVTRHLANRNGGLGFAPIRPRLTPRIPGNSGAAGSPDDIRTRDKPLPDMDYRCCGPPKRDDPGCRRWNRASHRQCPGGRRQLALFARLGASFRGATAPRKQILKFNRLASSKDRLEPKALSAFTLSNLAEHKRRSCLKGCLAP